MSAISSKAMINPTNGQQPVIINLTGPYSWFYVDEWNKECT